MRRWLFGLSLLIAASGMAAPPVYEAPIRDVCTPATITLTPNTAWSMIPASATGNCAGRSGLTVSNPAVNSGVMGFALTLGTSISVSTSIRPIELSPGEGFSVQLGTDLNVWAVTITTNSTENLHYQEFKQ